MPPGIARHSRKTSVSNRCMKPPRPAFETAERSITTSRIRKESERKVYQDAVALRSKRQPPARTHPDLCLMDEFQPETKATPQERTRPQARHDQASYKHTPNFC